jgi:hypothetical protein
MCCSDVIVLFGCNCVVRLLIVLFCVVFVCKCVLPPGDNPIAVNKYIIYHKILQLQGAEPRIVVCHVNTPRSCCLKHLWLLEFGYVKGNVAIRRVTYTGSREEMYMRGSVHIVGNAHFTSATTWRHQAREDDVTGATTGWRWERHREGG